MKVTSAQVAKRVRDLKAQLALVLAKEKESKLFTAAVTEKVDEVRPKYDFVAVQLEIEQLETKIRTYKHALNVFNATTIVPGYDMTIDEMLIYLPQLSSAVTKLTDMSNRLPRRRVDGTFSRPASIIEYEYTNYDVDMVKAACEAAAKELSNAQLALDKINNNEVFDVDIDDEI